MQFTYSPLEKKLSSSPSRHQRKHFAVQLPATRENISQFTYSPPEETFCSSHIRHQSKHFAVHLIATRENILQFTNSPREKTFCSSHSPLQRNTLQFTYLPPEKTLCNHLLAQRKKLDSSPSRHQRKHFAIHLPATRETISQFTYSPSAQTLTRYHSVMFVGSNGSSRCDRLI